MMTRLGMILAGACALAVATIAGAQTAAPTDAKAIEREFDANIRSQDQLD